MTVVEMPDGTEIDFPDSMSKSDIAAAIEKLSSPMGQTISAPKEPSKRYTIDRAGIRERKPTRTELIGDMGLPIDKGGGNVRSRLAESAGKVEDIKRELAKQFGVDDIDVGNIDGVGVVFKNPKTGQYEPLNPPGLDVGDVVSGLTEIPVFAGEAIGGLVGLRGGVPGVAAGSAAGGGAARAGQLSILKGLGIISDKPAEIAQKAGVEAAIAGAGALLPSAAGGMRQLGSPRLRALRTFTEAGVTAQDLRAGQEALAPLEAETGARLSTGQRLSVVNPEVGARIRATETSNQVATGELERAATQRRATERLTSAAAPSSPPDIEKTGVDIADIARTETLRQSEAFVRDTAKEINTIKRGLAAISGPDATTGGATIREILQTGRDRVFSGLSGQYDDLWAQVPEKTRVKAETLRATAEKWREKLNEDIFPSLAPEDKVLVREALNAGIVREEGMQFGADNILIPVTRIRDVGASLPASTRALSLLKAQIRLLERRPELAQIKEKKLLKELTTDLQNARNETLGSIDPELAAKIQKQDALWHEAKTAIDEALVGDVLTRRKGARYRVPDDKVLRSMTSSDANLRDYLTLGQKYPELNARDELKKAFYGKYADEVIDGTAGHQVWMRRNQAALKRIFSRDEMEKFQSAQNMQDSIKRAEKKESLLLSELQKSFEYRLGTFDPEEVVTVAAGRPTQARKIRNLLSKHPEKWEAYQDVRRQQILESGIPDGVLKGFNRQ